MLRKIQQAEIYDRDENKEGAIGIPIGTNTLADFDGSMSRD